MIHTYVYVVAPYNAAISVTVVNNSIIYTCDADGGPRNHYLWIYEQMIENSHQLIFTAKDQSNAGTYQCVIINSAGRATISFTYNGTCVHAYVCTYVRKYIAMYIRILSEFAIIT